MSSADRARRDRLHRIAQSERDQRRRAHAVWTRARVVARLDELAAEIADTADELTALDRLEAGR